MSDKIKPREIYRFQGGTPDIERIQAATNSRLGTPSLPQTVKPQPREEVGQNRPFLAAGFVVGFVAGWCAVWRFLANAARRASNRGSHTDAHIAHAQPLAVQYAYHDPNVDGIQYIHAVKYADQYANADQHTNKHTKPNPDANTDQHAKPNEHTNANQYANTDKHIDAEPNTYPDQRTDTNGRHVDFGTVIRRDACGGCSDNNRGDCCDGCV
jgi:hypothetical protein